LAIRRYTEELGAFSAQYGQDAAHTPSAVLQRTLSAAKSILHDIEALEQQHKEAESRKLELQLPGVEWILSESSASLTARISEFGNQ